MYLLDTNILSAGAPGRQRSAELVDWMHRNSDRLHLSVITIAEVEDGIAKARREVAIAKAARLTEWLETVLHLYASRILSLDIGTARVLGALSDLARGAGLAPGFADLGIAATAKRHGYTILTRNLRHFRPLGVPAMDPFEALPTASEA